MKTILKQTFSFKTHYFSIPTTILLLLFHVACKKNMTPWQNENEQITNNLMLVYPNVGKKLSFVDYHTYKVVKNVTLDVPDSLQVYNICLSTNKDYLIFCGSIEKPPFSNFIISYNIAKNTITNIFATGLDSVGAPRLTAAFLPDEPSLIYLYSHNVGMYSINFITKTVNMISRENWIPKDFYTSPDEKCIIINKYFPGYTNDYTEVEFYYNTADLNYPNFVLNKDDQDGIDVTDLTFSQDNTKLYIAYLLSQRRAVKIAAYFGSYNMETRMLDSSMVTLPWSENPYYMSYSPIRKEAYLVGAQDKLYILDIKQKNYSISGLIDLTGKIPSPSELLLRPDEKVLFVSCVYSNFVIAIDLEKRSILKKIHIESPYLIMLL